MRIVILLLLFSFGALSANPLDPVVRSTQSAQQFYSQMIDSYQKEDWRRLLLESQDLIEQFSSSPFAREAHYYLGVAYFHLRDLDLANKAFTTYLKEESSPRFFHEVLKYKFEIASAFHEGERMHLFGWQKMPKWLPAYDEALELYDEITTSLPRDDLSAEALFRKGQLLLRMEEYKKSVEAFKTLIRRFPKHPLAPKSYLSISDVYLSELKVKFPDPDKLDLAEINLRNFRTHFPTEPMVDEAREKLLTMKERLAAELFEIGEFYKRTKKKSAAQIYYQTILKKYPETKVAQKSKKLLQSLQPKTVQDQTPSQDLSAHKEQNQDVSALSPSSD